MSAPTPKADILCLTEIASWLHNYISSRRSGLECMSSKIAVFVLAVSLWSFESVSQESMIYAQETFEVGTKFVLDSRSPLSDFAVVFEDDGRTGYFYGLNMSASGNPIVDAMQIYNVDNVSDRHIPSEVSFVWSADGEKALLLINDYAHAVFDFDTKRGYCRTNFPSPNPNWTQHSHEWSDDALLLFD